MNDAEPTVSDPRSARTVGELLARRAALQPEEPVFVSYGRDGPGEPIRYGPLYDAASRAAAALRTGTKRGDRVVLVFANEPDFLTVFLGCILAGLVAVPMAVPRNTKALERLLAISAQAGASIGIAGSALKGRLEKLGGESAEFDWLYADGLMAMDAAPLQPIQLDASDVAVLQFTSGSTGLPKAVMVRHSNILHNCAMLESVCGAGADMRMVSWLPFFHDWGLFGCLLFPIYTGGLNYFMDPSEFLRRPMHWIQAIGSTRSRVSCAPDFAYAQAAADAGDLAGSDLDLSCWRLAMMGAEPVRPDTMRAFAEAFTPVGFRPAALFPSYGLAESTLIVTGGDPEAEPVPREFDRAALKAGEARPAVPGAPAQVLVSVGRPLLEQRVVIADPDDGRTCPERAVGEVWVAGPSVTAGYLNRADETEETYEARLPGDSTNWLRTGDLGFLDEGELFVCGRLKDVIIKAGVNYFAEDLEHSASGAHPALRPNCGAAFAVDAAGAERLAIAFEIDYGPRPDLEHVVSALQRSIRADHDVFADAILILKPGTLEKTSSGKIRRQKAAADFVDGRLDPLRAWQSWSDPANSADG